MRLEHHLVGGYVRYTSPHIIIITCCPTSAFYSWGTGVQSSAITSVLPSIKGCKGGGGGTWFKGTKYAETYDKEDDGDHEVEEGVGRG